MVGRNMAEYRIDLNEIDSREALHDLLEQVLPLPDYYGRNLDALYDVITDWNTETKISVCGTESAIQKDGMEGIVQGLLSVFRDAAGENPNLSVIIEEQTDKEEGLMGNKTDYIASAGQTYIPFQKNIHTDLLPYDPPAKPDPLLPALELTEEAIAKGYALPSQKQHFLPGVTSEMMDWFWANMEKGYYLWAPGSHKRFNWIKSPVEYGMEDSIHMIAETTAKGLPVFGGEGVQIHRLHLDDFYPCKTALKHVLCEGVFNDLGEFVDSTIHEWEDVPGGLVHITATVSNTKASMPPGFVLKMIEEDPNVKIVPNWATDHEDYEASQWPIFLPKLYELWKNHPDPAQNVQCNLEVALGEDGKYHYIAENGPVQIPEA